MKAWLKRHSLICEMFIVIVLWILTIAARLKFNGLVYGLDFGLFHPDGSLYTMQSFIFSGVSKIQASNLVNHFYLMHASKHNIIDVTVLYDRPNWQEYKLRILYPLLSVPFVKILGVYGMLVVPAFAFLVLLLFPVYLANKRNLPYIGLGISICLISSGTIVRWMFVNTSDSLLVLVCIVVVLVLSKVKINSRLILTLMPLVVASSLTRFTFLIWLGIALVFLWLRDFMVSVSLIVLSLICALPVLFISKASSILPATSGSSLFDRLIQYPITLVKICVYELGELFVLDKLLFFVLISATCYAIFRLKQLSSKFFLAALISLIITGSINGVLGVNFRYQMPLIPFLIWLTVDAVSNFYSQHEKIQDN